MNDKLDVYIHDNGTVELRRPVQLPPGKRDFTEHVMCPAAAQSHERRWTQYRKLNGVMVWVEL